MNVLNWLRKLGGIEEYAPTTFEAEHYARFEKALEEGDVEVDVYDECNKGRLIIAQGELLHPVTPKNLVQYRKLNRRERRYYNTVTGFNNEKQDHHLHRQSG